VRRARALTARVVAARRARQVQAEEARREEARLGRAQEPVVALLAQEVAQEAAPGLVPAGAGPAARRWRRARRGG
jgi:hypothetical protein